MNGHVIRRTSLGHMFSLTFVPGLPVLSSSSDVGDGEDPPEMSDEDEAGDAEARRDGDVEAPVAVQETGMGAVQLDALLVNDEHGDLSAVLGGIEDLEKKKHGQGQAVRNRSRTTKLYLGSSSVLESEERSRKEEQ